MTITKDQLEDLAQTAKGDAESIPEGAISEELRDGLRLIAGTCQAAAERMAAEGVDTIHNEGTYPPTGG